MSAVACKTALESLTNIDAATCFLESNGATSASLVATLKFSNAPEMNNINKHNGSPLASAFACDTSRLDGAVVFLPVLVGFAHVVRATLLASCTRTPMCVGWAWLCIHHPSGSVVYTCTVAVVDLTMGIKVGSVPVPATATTYMVKVSDVTSVPNKIQVRNPGPRGAHIDSTSSRAGPARTCNSQRVVLCLRRPPLPSLCAVCGRCGNYPRRTPALASASSPVRQAQTRQWADWSCCSVPREGTLWGPSGLSPRPPLRSR